MTKRPNMSKDDPVSEHSLTDALERISVAQANGENLMTEMRQVETDLKNKMNQMQQELNRKVTDVKLTVEIEREIDRNTKSSS